MKLELELSEQEVQRLREEAARRLADCHALLEPGEWISERERPSIEEEAKLWGKLFLITRKAGKEDV